MAEQRDEYRVMPSDYWENDYQGLNELAREGYELTHIVPGQLGRGAYYVLRLRLSAEQAQTERAELDELVYDLDARLTSLAADVGRVAAVAQGIARRTDNAHARLDELNGYRLAQAGVNGSLADEIANLTARLDGLQPQLATSERELMFRIERLEQWAAAGAQKWP